MLSGITGKHIRKRSGRIATYGFSPHGKKAYQNGSAEIARTDKREEELHAMLFPGNRRI